MLGSMKRFGLVATATVGLFACQYDDKSINQKLDQINNRLTAIEARLGQGGAPGAAARPPQPGGRAQPDPNAVYAVPIADSAAIGPPHAKVTIVEAFTFT
jgi:protein-disulfide isomerase